MTIFLDNHEAPDLYLSLSQSAPVEMANLNVDGYADLYWIGYGNKSYSIEHKQVGEILGGLDDVEELLSREYGSCDQLYLVVEGVLLPKGANQAETLGWSMDGKMAFRQGKQRPKVNGKKPPVVPYDFNWEGWESWKESLERLWGVIVKEPPNREALVRTIVALYNHSQKAPEEHTTMTRAIRPKLNIPVALPMVRSLMGLCGPDSRTNCGESTATALERQYGSLWALANADPAEVAEVRLESGRRVGKAWVQWFCKALGRVE